MGWIIRIEIGVNICWHFYRCVRLYLAMGILERSLLLMREEYLKSSGVHTQLSLQWFKEFSYTRNTIEERMQDILNRKRSLFKAVIDDLSDKKLSKALTEEEFFSLFNLKKPVRRWSEPINSSLSGENGSGVSSFTLTPALSRRGRGRQDDSRHSLPITRYVFIPMTIS